MVVAGALAAAGCATFPRAPDEGGPAWIQVSSPHFALATDMDREPAEDLARTLESWWAAMGVAMPAVGDRASNGVDDEADPVIVIALRNGRERDAVHYRIGGVFSVLPLLPTVISIGDFADERGRETLKHELAHALLHKRLRRVPQWLTEGMAVYLQTAELDRKHRVVQWGEWNASEMRDVMEYRGGVSIETLLDPTQWVAGGDWGAMEIYAGMLVHFLINRHPAELDCYLKRLATETDSNAAMACFSDRDKWNYDLRDYAYSWSFARQTVAFDPPDAYVQTAPLKDARVHAILALLDFTVLFTVLPQFRDQRVERARHSLERALALDPDEYLALLLTLTHTKIDPQRHADITKALVRDHAGDWRAWVARARTPNLPVHEQVQAVDRAQRLAPEETEVIRLAALRALSEKRWADARALGTKAWLGGADDIEDRIVLFLASALPGSCTEGWKWSRTPSDTDAFSKALADVQGQLGLPPSTCPPPPATQGHEATR